MFKICLLANPVLSGCDVSAITDFSSMFQLAQSFNQDLTSWDMSNAQILDYMFLGASAFNSSIWNWNIINVTSAVLFLEQSGFSLQNYTSLIMLWSNKAVQPNVVFGAGSIKYMAKAQARHDVLTSPPNNWIITDGGPE
jgi:hypothetical protein